MTMEVWFVLLFSPFHSLVNSFPPELQEKLQQLKKVVLPARSLF